MKLARALTRVIHRAVARQQRVEAMVRDAHNAGCQVIAAGISSEEEAACCRELGCHLGQGSLYRDSHGVPLLAGVNDEPLHA